MIAVTDLKLTYSEPKTESGYVSSGKISISMSEHINFTCNGKTND